MRTDSTLISVTVGVAVGASTTHRLGLRVRFVLTRYGVFALVRNHLDFVANANVFQSPKQPVSMRRELHFRGAPW